MDRRIAGRWENRVAGGGKGEWLEGVREYGGRIRLLCGGETRVIVCSLYCLSLRAVE